MTSPCQLGPMERSIINSGFATAARHLTRCVGRAFARKPTLEFERHDQTGISKVPEEDGARTLGASARQSSCKNFWFCADFLKFQRRLAGDGVSRAMCDFLDPVAVNAARGGAPRVPWHARSAREQTATGSRRVRTGLNSRSVGVASHVGLPVAAAPKACVAVTQLSTRCAPVGSLEHGTVISVVDY